MFKVAYAFEKIHDKGPYKLYKIPETDIEHVVNERLSGKAYSKV